mmetsp:Transcript_1110/g.4147  ORF Transcript_1110/g.4147 Transcript_1110/m.4147 type:complete len:231 (+) Transcript_1110:807-1499(+)
MCHLVAFPKRDSDCSFSWLRIGSSRSSCLNTRRSLPSESVMATGSSCAAAAQITATSPTVAVSPSMTAGDMPITSRTLASTSKNIASGEPLRTPTGRSSSSMTTAIPSRPTAAAAGPAGSSSLTTNLYAPVSLPPSGLENQPREKPASTASLRAVSSRSISSSSSSSSSIVMPTSGISRSRVDGSTPPRNISGSASPAKSRPAAPAHSSSASAASEDLSDGAPFGAVQSY